ncbi:carbohydrate sulfotransferase 3-like [Ptychodera flava]|uniref:carbohydrate sulfotransferase 3-like n=1 Tax=Ptychodera flava TaxID=63121 RepID=UPI00396A6669
MRRPSMLRILFGLTLVPFLFSLRFLASFPLWDPRQAELSSYESGPTENFIPTVNAAKSTGRDEASAVARVNVLIQSRFRTGSTLIERYFTKDANFFGVHEPGLMLQRDFGLRLMDDSRGTLETIREKLLVFMHDIYHCNFSSHDYLFASLNRNEFHLTRTYLTGLERPVTDDVIRPVCNARPNKIIKVCRMFSIFESEQLIRRNNVKVIFLVRDPRAMIASRMAFTNSNTPEKMFDSDKYEQFRLERRTERIATDYCQWLRENYIAPSNVPDWLKGRYLMVRYEDVESQPDAVNRLYDFVGVRMRFAVSRLIPRIDVGNNAERWRQNMRIEEVMRVQELCGRSTFDKFGYKTVGGLAELLDNTTSLVSGPSEEKFSHR